MPGPTDADNVRAFDRSEERDPFAEALDDADDLACDPAANLLVDLITTARTMQGAMALLARADRPDLADNTKTLIDAINGGITNRLPSRKAS